METSAAKSRKEKGSGPIMPMDLPEQEQHVKVDNQPFPSAYYTGSHLEDGMHELTCLIQSCQAKVYAPAGTHSVCRAHFLSYLTWRRRKGPQMFMKYAGMTMEERDPVVAEWANTIRVEAPPTASAPTP
jgi:hypothetical protein